MSPYLTRIAVALALTSTVWGCALLQDDGRPKLQPGIRVEAKGKTDRIGTVDDIEQKDPDNRLEARGSLVVAVDGRVELLGVPLILDDDTEFENADKEEIDRPTLETGMWVLARGQETPEGFRVRKLRLQTPRGKWEIEGVVDEVDGRIPGDPDATFVIGPYSLGTRPGTDVLLLDPLREWRQFLDEGPLARRAGKEEKFLPYSIELGDRTRLGGNASFSYEHEDDFNLRRDRDRDDQQFELRAKLSMIHKIGEESFLLVEGQGVSEHELKDERENEKSLDFEPSEVYVFVPNLLFEGFHIQVGRQNLDEEREWYFDENLDAARFYWERGPLQFDVSISQTPRVLEAGIREPSVNYIGGAHYRVNEDWTLSAYVVDRRSRELDNFSPFHYGVRSYREARRGLSHWIDIARADGIVDGERLQGTAIDTGVTYIGSHDLQPSVTLSYAWAQGNHPRGRKNRTFRQTGLQDNNGKWNGVTSFRYYGEVFDPELSNMSVLTAGVGVRPTRRSSIDLVIHGYRQDTAIADNLISGIKAQPNGRHRNLGRELDLIFGLRRPRLTTEVVTGVFQPGAAFDHRKAALFAAFQLRFKF